MSVQNRIRLSIQTLVVTALAAILVVPAPVTAEASNTIPFTIAVTSSSTGNATVGNTVIKPGQKVTLNLKDPTIWFGNGTKKQKCDYRAENVFRNVDGTTRTTASGKNNVSNSGWGTNFSSVRVTLTITNCYTPTKVTYSMTESATGSVLMSVRDGGMLLAPSNVTYTLKPVASYPLPVRTSRECKVTVTVNGKTYSSNTQKKSHSFTVPFSTSVRVNAHSCKA